MTTTTYLTVARAGSAEVEVRRSRFLAHVERVETETWARAVVEAARKEHWDARHHCWASVVGPDAGVQRASDDGEPSGTAGAPMLEVLRGRDLSDVVVVVTRRFGGTLLGPGGLVRAYSDAVRAVLDEVGVRPRVLMSRFDLAAGHAEAARWEADLRSRGVTVLGVDHAEHAILHLAVPTEEVDVLTARVASLTAGSAGLAPVGDTWVDGSVA